MPEVENRLYKLITATGPDAEPFLQGQLTQDVSRTIPGDALLSAWCNPKGRVIAVLRVVSVDGGFGLVAPASLAEDLVRRFLLFRFRAKVDVQVTDDDCHLFPGVGDLDPAALVRAGIPTIDSGNTEVFTAHMLNLDRLGAINFTKGCYTGQEIIARTEHRGKSRRRMMRYRVEGEVAAGAKLSLNDRDVGEVVNVAADELLAVAPTDVHREALHCGTARCTPLDLPYALD